MSIIKKILAVLLITVLLFPTEPVLAAYRKSKGWGLQKPPVGYGIDFGDPINTGVAGYWIFNEGAGLKAYDLLGRNIGTLTGTPTWVAGKFGKALNFDGSSHYVSLPSTPDTQNEQSISAWVNTTTTTGTRSIFVNSNSGQTSAQMIIVLNQAGAGKISLGWVTTTVVSSNATLSTNTWYHIVCVRSGTTGAWTGKIYINGVLDNTGSTAVNPSNKQINAIGRYGAFNSLFWSGKIDGVRYWGRALSASEVSRLYTEPFAGIVTPKRRTISESGAAAPSHTYFNVKLY